MFPYFCQTESTLTMLAADITYLSNCKMMPSYFLCSDIILVETVKQNYVTAHATNHKVDTAVKMWLKFASDRNGGRRNR